MKRSTFITWDQLKVGVMILVALGILGVAIVKLGEAANLFTKRYELVTFLPSATGLTPGGPVTLAGQLAGVVKKIEFLPPDADTTRNLKLTLEIDRSLQQHVREDSRATLRAVSLLGDKQLDISVGTPRYAALQPGDTVQVLPSVELDQVLSKASGALSDVADLTHDVRAITGGMVRGEGTVGQLLTNRTLYDQLAGTLTQTNALLTRLQRPNGTFGRMIDDPTLYMRLTSTATSLDSLLRSLQTPTNTVGRLLHDDSLYVRLLGTSKGADSLMRLFTQGTGTASRLLNDAALYDRLNKTLTDLDSLISELRTNPRKFTKGLIKVF